MAVSRQKFNVEDEFELPQKSGSSKGSEEKDTEHNRVAELGRNRGTARRQAQETAKDPNEADRLEIEAMKARVEQLDSDSGSSLTAKQNGQGDIELNLKFNVPIPGVTGSPTGQRSQIKKGVESSKPSTQSAIENEAPSPMSNQPNTPTKNPPDTFDSNDSKGESKKMNDNQDEFKKAMEKERDQMLSTSPQKKDRGTEPSEAPPFTNEQTPENTPEDESLTDRNEEGTEENTETAQSEEKKSTQGGQAAENASFEIEKEKKEQEEKEEALKQQEQEQKKGEAKAMQDAQKQAQQQQSLSSEYAKAVRKKQNLDRKLNRLKLERFAVWLALRMAKTLKAIIDFIQNLLWKGGIVCIGSCILFLLGILCFILYGLLWIINGPLFGIIVVLKKKLSMIDEDIKKTKENQQKAISVIQSIQRKKRTGTAKPAPKFDVPQQAG